MLAATAGLLIWRWDDPAELVAGALKLDDLAITISLIAIAAAAFAARLPGRARVIEVKANLDYYGYGDLPGTQVAQTTDIGAAGAGGSGTGGGESLTPTVVRGRDGFLFYGTDFAGACARSEQLAAALDDFAAVARIIERSGRRVAFTVAPDKSSVVEDALPRAVPRGACAKDGIRRQNQVLDTFSAPGWIPLRRELVALHESGADVYWRTDTHWTDTGASIYASRVVEAFRPGTPVDFTRGEEQRVGDLTKLIGLDFSETVRSQRIDTGGTVRRTSAPGPVDRGLVTWRTTPDDRTVRGRTLLIGDSFTYTVLKHLAPVFADGRFIRVDNSSEDELIDQIVAADNIALERVTRSMTDLVVATPDFRRKLARRLGVSAD